MTSSPLRATIYFDLASTLGAVRLRGLDGPLERITPFPSAIRVLETLRRAGGRVGIVVGPGWLSPEGEGALRGAGLLSYIDEHLVIGNAHTAAFFEEAAGFARRGQEANGREHQIVYVDSNARARGQARLAGFLTAPHPALALPVLWAHGPLRYACIRVPGSLVREDWIAHLHAVSTVPFHIADTSPAEPPTIFATVGELSASRLVAAGFRVDLLGEPDEPQSTDPYMVWGPVLTKRSAEPPDGLPLVPKALISSLERTLISVGPGQRITSMTGEPHVHAVKLATSCGFFDAEHLTPEPALSGAYAALARGMSPALDQQETAALRSQIREAEIETLVKRYSGAAPLSGTVWIKSRHLLNRVENERVISALQHDFKELRTEMQEPRLRVHLDPFTNECEHHSVEATLPRREMEGVVVISAHLDSFVDRNLEAGHVGATDREPGADDDASGIAGVLCTARAILHLSRVTQRRHREIRFVLFNGEEFQLSGSVDYACNQRDAGIRELVTFQMDMIGYDGNRDRVFGVHAGYSETSQVQELSLALAKLVEALALTVPEYPLSPRVHVGSDGHHDHAQARSDHTGFHIFGYPACLICEDFFGAPTEPEESPGRNKAYHTSKDTVEKLNIPYATDIARVVAAAAWIAATR